MADYFDRNTLIMNRSQKDVQELQYIKEKWLNGTITESEKAKWLAGMKGAYNASDINRVSAAMLYYAEVLTELGYEVFVSFLKTDWAATETNSTITSVYWESFFESVNNLNSVFSLPIQSTPDFQLPTSLEELNIKTANSIEQMLYDLDIAISMLRKTAICSGEAYSGEF